MKNRQEGPQGPHAPAPGEIKAIDRMLDRSRLDAMMAEFPTDRALLLANVWLVKDSIRAKVAEACCPIPEKIVLAFAPPQKFLDPYSYKMVPDTSRGVPVVIIAVEKLHYDMATRLRDGNHAAVVKVGHAGSAYTLRPGLAPVQYLMRLELLLLAEIHRLHADLPEPEEFRSFLANFGAGSLSLVPPADMAGLLDEIRRAEVIIATPDGEAMHLVHGRARIEAAKRNNEGVHALRIPIDPETDDYDQLVGLVRAERGGDERPDIER